MASKTVVFDSPVRADVVVGLIPWSLDEAVAIVANVELRPAPPAPLEPFQGGVMIAPSELENAASVLRDRVHDLISALIELETASVGIHERYRAAADVALPYYEGLQATLEPFVVTSIGLVERAAPELAVDVPEVVAQPLSLLSGWVPGNGLWLAYLNSVLPGGAGFKYHFGGRTGWDSASQLTRLRASSNTGFEFSFAYKDKTPGAPTSQDGDTSAMSSWISDFPGLYHGYVTVDDQEVTWEIGTHEADKLKWVYQDDPSFHKDYRHTMVIHDPQDYRISSNRPSLTVFGQADFGMGCGNQLADACFNADDGHNFNGNAYQTFPVSAKAW